MILRCVAQSALYVTSNSCRPRKTTDPPEAIIEWQQVCLRKATITVERASFGPIGVSWTKSRFFHFITVFGFTPQPFAQLLD
jgi:hypothetical protein